MVNPRNLLYNPCMPRISAQEPFALVIFVYISSYFKPMTSVFHSQSTLAAARRHFLALIP